MLRVILVLAVALGGCVDGRAVPVDSAPPVEPEAPSVCSMAAAQSLIVERCGDFPTAKTVVQVSADGDSYRMSRDSFDSLVEFIWAIAEYRACIDER